MNEWLVRTEAELMIAKDALMSSELDTMKEMKMNERLLLVEEKLAKTEAEYALTKAKTVELEREVAILRAPPFIHACGSSTDWISISGQTIPYTSLLYSSTNTEG